MNMKTSNMSLRLGLFSLLVLATPLLCSAEESDSEGPVIRSGESVGVEADQLLEGDFYGLGNTVTISGEAARDVYALGGTVTTNAPVNEDLVAIGGVVQIHGEVKDDARIIGGEIVIAEPIADDLVVIGGTVHVLSTAHISGDLIFFGGELQIDGPIDGTIYGTGGTVRIDAAVGGNVSVRTSESLTLGDNASIKGSITYKSNSEMVRAQNAVVMGTITHEAFAEAQDRSLAKPILLNILIIVFSSLTLFFLAKSRTDTLVLAVREGYGRFGLIGLGMMLALPLVAIVLMTSIIGVVVGIALLLSYVVLIMVALMCVPIVLGALLQRLIRLGTEVSFFTVLIGVVGTIVLALIPVIGWLALTALHVIILGALCDFFYRFFKQS
jgi:hypothetical protein